MNLIEATAKAHEVIAQYNVRDTYIEWDNSRSRGGVCKFYPPTFSHPNGRRVIIFSRVAFKAMPEHEQVDTILHEIAHARLPHSAGHGPQWQAIARSMGCTAEKAVSSVEIALRVAKWHALCVVSGQTISGCNRLTDSGRRKVCTCHRVTVKWVPNS